MTNEKITEILDKCKKCVYYCKSNNTCQLKKCRLGTEGYVTLFDKASCNPPADWMVAKLRKQRLER